MNFLTKQEIDQLDLTNAKQTLKQLKAEYDLDQPLNEIFDTVWPVIDPLTNNLIWLEDRIYYTETCARLDSVRRVNPVTE